MIYCHSTHICRTIDQLQNNYCIKLLNVYTSFQVDQKSHLTVKIASLIRNFNASDAIQPCPKEVNQQQDRQL